MLKVASARRWRAPAWKSAGVAALLCSGVAFASLPRAVEANVGDERQWQALAVSPLSSGGVTGMPMSASETVQPVGFVPHRPSPVQLARGSVARTAPSAGLPLRIHGRVGEGLYWSLRAAGASPQAAAQYLSAIATQIDVGEVAQSDAFDLVLGADGGLLYAGLIRVGAPPMQLVRWSENGRTEWLDAGNVATPRPAEGGIAMPAAGPITSYFGYRYHPILHFTRFHAGVDIGAGWGSPIVAAADGRVLSAGWSGGFGREVEIAHVGGLTSVYGHMSEIVAQPGSVVHAGQLIGYVGSSGLSTGPHLHFEVRKGGTPINPLGIRLASLPVANPRLAEAVKARLKNLLALAGTRG